ncbi:hypothetical protein ZWY2020_054825 [Hordeum vulgare]|nr:hypothetical protein ZWY2020_054825 [Hordeum vulgare]
MLQLGHRLAYHGLCPRLVTTRHLLATVPLCPLPPPPSPTASAMATWHCPDFGVRPPSRGRWSNLEALFCPRRAEAVCVFVTTRTCLGGLRAPGVPTTALFSQPRGGRRHEEVSRGVGLPAVVDGARSAAEALTGRRASASLNGGAGVVIVHIGRDGEFRASAIAEFVSANKIPLITTLTQETAPAIFDNPIKKQLLFVFVERDNEEVGEPVANYFGITGQETTVLAYTRNEDAEKFFFNGEISLDSIKMRETDGPVKSTASSAAPVCFPSSLLQGIFCWCHGDRGPGQDHTGAKTNGMCAVPRENVHLDKIWQPFECQCDF